jgi:hypothetical protein
MADGTYRPIADVTEGDIVLTGTGFGNGVVTKKTVTPVLGDDAQDVVVVTTAIGELVGTAHHPVFLENDWPELGTVADMELIPSALSNVVSRFNRTQRVVGAWHNLEIDGNVEYKEKSELISSHSYIVNGMVVSGLGDNLKLKIRLGRGSLYKGDSLTKLLEELNTAIDG